MLKKDDWQLKIAQNAAEGHKNVRPALAGGVGLGNGRQVGLVGSHHLRVVQFTKTGPEEFTGPEQVFGCDNETQAGCVLVISHDRWFLDRIATHILAFEGDSHVEWFEGNFQDYEEDKKRRLGEDSVMPSWQADR